MKKLDLNPGTKRYILQEYEKKSEKDFMQEVLLPLFENMRFETSYTHGPNEMGKDFILKKQDAFGDYDFTAVIVKKGNISNTKTSKNKNTLEEVRRQVNQALKNPLDGFGSKRRFPSKAIVITSGRISNSARQEISNNQDYSSEKVTFIESEQLITLLDKHYPIFFLFKMPEMAKYLSDLLDYIKSMTSIDSKFSSYIDHLNLYCRKDIKKNDTLSSPKEKPENIFSRRKNYWLQGGTGSGKTYTIYKLAEKSLQLLKNTAGKNVKIEKKKIILPVYARAHHIKPSEVKDDLPKFLLSLIKKYSQFASLDNIKNWLKEYHLLLAIDDFEQKPDQKIVDLIMDYKIQYPSLSVVFLSREIEKSSFKFKLSIEVWRLLDLNLNGVKSALKVAIPKENKRALNIYNDLLKEDILKKIPRTPLAINALSHVFSENIKTTPSNTWEFFDMFFEIVLGRWETGRNPDSILDYNQVRHFFEIVALDMVKQGVRAIPIMLLIPHAKKVLQSISDDQMKPVDFIKEVSKFGEVATIRNNDFLFTQKTFQEFLAGCEYANHHWDKKHIIDNVIELNWEDCLIFAAGKKKRDPELLSSLKSISEKNHAHLFFKMKNIALLVQALYQTDRSKKKEALDVGLQTTIKLRDDDIFINRMQTLLNNKDEIFLSLLTLIGFSYYYGRSSLAPILQDIFESETSDRKKAFLFCAFIEEFLERSTPEEMKKIIDLLPRGTTDSEIIAIAPYLEIEGNKLNANKIKELIKNKKMRKFIDKAKNIISKSLRSKRSKYIK